MNRSAFILLVMWFRNSNLHSRVCEPFDTLVVTFAVSPCCSNIERRLDASAVISESFTTSRSILFLLRVSRHNFRVCPPVIEITHISKLQEEKPPLPNSLSCVMLLLPCTQWIKWRAPCVDIPSFRPHVSVSNPYNPFFAVRILFLLHRRVFRVTLLRI